MKHLWKSLWFFYVIVVSLYGPMFLLNNSLQVPKSATGTFMHIVLWASARWSWILGYDEEKGFTPAFTITDLTSPVILYLHFVVLDLFFFQSPIYRPLFWRSFSFQLSLDAMIIIHVYSVSNGVLELWMNCLEFFLSTNIQRRRSSPARSRKKRKKLSGVALIFRCT